MTEETGEVCVRIDRELKEQAEAILAETGVTPADLIQALYRQVVQSHGLPFEVRGPLVVSADGLTDEDIAAVIEERMKSYAKDKEYTRDEFRKALEEKYGI